MRSSVPTYVREPSWAWLKAALFLGALAVASFVAAREWNILPSLGLALVLFYGSLALAFALVAFRARKRSMPPPGTSVAALLTALFFTLAIFLGISLASQFPPPL